MKRAVARCFILKESVRYAESIAAEMQLSQDAVNQIGVAGLMHDIGKMGIDEKILNKQGRLNFEEWQEIQRHPEIGYRILSSSNEFSEMSRNMSMSIMNAGMARAIPKTEGRSDLDSGQNHRCSRRV